MVVRDCVPELWFAPVIVVNRVEHQVLVVPAERRELHAYVEPRDVDAGDVSGLRELHQRVRLLVQVIQVHWVI